VAPAVVPAEQVTDAGAQPDKDDTQAIFGLALGGAGLVGVGVGAYFGMKAADTDDEAESICPRVDPCNDQRGIELTDDAQSQALVANVLYGVGGAALVAGVVLYLTADDGSESSSARPLRAFELGAARIRPDAFFTPSFSGISVNTEF
jgi:serine/threonine-protein kinase